MKYLIYNSILYYPDTIPGRPEVIMQENESDKSKVHSGWQFFIDNFIDNIGIVPDLVETLSAPRFSINKKSKTGRLDFPLDTPLPKEMEATLVKILQALGKAD